MISDQQTIIRAAGVISLCWDRGALVDTVGKNVRFNLDGTRTSTRVHWAYRFDSTAVSPSGRFTAIYERLGTKGLLLDNGKCVREINRSFYHAGAYDYPILLFALDDGREVIAHCPNAYCQLEIEDLATGQRLTTRSFDGVKNDYFYSCLNISPDGKKLLSCGWVWHPAEIPQVYDVSQALADPASLDQNSTILANCPAFGAAFLTNSQIALAGIPDAEIFDEDSKSGLRPGTIGVFDLGRNEYLSVAPLEDRAGLLMGVGPDYVLGFHDHPKLIEVSSGKIVRRWMELKTGQRESCIHSKPLPPLALDPAQRRFAVADDQKITVVRIGFS